jgi:carboxymethylenebutenolidase
MKLTEKDIKIKSKDGIEIRSYITHPEEKGVYPGIIIIHEIWGLNTQIKGVARRYAKEGYAVLAPHLFSRGGATLEEENIKKAMIPLFSLPREKRYDPSALKDLMAKMTESERKVVQILFQERESLEQKIVKDAMTCYEYFKNLDIVKGRKLGVTGFCFGAGLAFQLSTLLPFDASVIFYGANPKPIESISKVKGPILALYAGEDEMVNAGIPALTEAMVKFKKTFTMKLYSGVQHAFFNETSSIYDKSSAEDSWRQAIIFFNTYLK